MCVALTLCGPDPVYAAEAQAQPSLVQTMRTVYLHTGTTYMHIGRLHIFVTPPHQPHPTAPGATLTRVRS